MFPPADLGKLHKRRPLKTLPFLVISAGEKWGQVCDMGFNGQLPDQSTLVPYCAYYK